jgi:hypothetical protein
MFDTRRQVGYEKGGADHLGDPIDLYSRRTGRTVKILLPEAT